MALLSGWLLINFIQSISTEIGNDEAYYWMFARHLQWGFFDHPPMIAFFIKLGGLFFNYELGVRIFTIIAQPISLYLAWRMLDEKEINLNRIFLFFGLAASIPIFQVYGFIATPDAPLLLFTATFLYCYKRFLKVESDTPIFLLALSMAGLMYSKYHGGLIIIFTILSNIKLLTNGRFLIAALIAIGLYIPHLTWQFQNDFPTFQYQMIDRMKPISTKYFLEFWLNQSIAFHPLVLGLVLLTLLKRTHASLFDQTLSTIVIGFFGFFWISSLWTRVEPHWTAAASLPVVILLYKNITSTGQYKKFVYHFLFPSLIILLVARLALIFDFLPFKLEFHNQKKWAADIESEAGSLPVVFINTYHRPSVYSFYTGKTSFTLNNIFYRKNQFDLWDYEENYQGKAVTFFILPSDSAYIPPIAEKVNNYFMIKETLSSVQKIRINYTLPDAPDFRPQEHLKMAVEITNPYPYPIPFNNETPVSMSAIFTKNKYKCRVPAVPVDSVMALGPGQSVNRIIEFLIPDIPPGTYRFGLGLKTELLPEAFNSHFQNIKIIGQY